MENVTSSSPPIISFSADAADRLEHAIKHMITMFMDEGLIQKPEVVTLLEDIIQKIESTSTGGSE